MGEKSENCMVSEDMFNGLKVTDTHEAECVSPPVANAKDDHTQSKLHKDVEARPQEDQEEEECFHDSSASFEEEPGPNKVENKSDDDVNSSELDEEYLIELEKNMPDEEKKVYMTFIVHDLLCCLASFCFCFFFLMASSTEYRSSRSRIESELQRPTYTNTGSTFYP